jgi:hypothetical protein
VALAPAVICTLMNLLSLLSYVIQLVPPVLLLIFVPLADYRQEIKHIYYQVSEYAHTPARLVIIKTQLSLFVINVIFLANIALCRILLALALFVTIIKDMFSLTILTPHASLHVPQANIKIPIHYLVCLVMQIVSLVLQIPQIV